MIGVLGCLRTILPHISAPVEPEVDLDAHRLDCLVQIYDLCLHYAKWHTDHNMVNAALETLAQLLESPDDDLVRILTSDSGIPSSKIITSENATRISLGQMSASTTTVSGDHSESRLTLFEPDLPEIHPNVEKWISDSINTLSEVHRSQIDTPPIPVSDALETTDKNDDDQSFLTSRSIHSRYKISFFL